MTNCKHHPDYTNELPRLNRIAGQINGIKNVIVIITHGIFSGQCIKRLQECNVISKIIVSDTICQKQNIEVLDKLEVFSISELLANVISNIINGNSLSLLFE